MTMPLLTSPICSSRLTIRYTVAKPILGSCFLALLQISLIVAHSSPRITSSIWLLWWVIRQPSLRSLLMIIFLVISSVLIPLSSV